MHAVIVPRRSCFTDCVIFLSSEQIHSLFIHSAVTASRLYTYIFHRFLDSHFIDIITFHYFLLQNITRIYVRLRQRSTTTLLIDELKTNPPTNKSSNSYTKKQRQTLCNSVFNEFILCVPFHSCFKCYKTSTTR